jgi:hypothetical protein
MNADFLNSHQISVHVADAREGFPICRLEPKPDTSEAIPYFAALADAWPFASGKVIHTASLARKPGCVPSFDGPALFLPARKTIALINIFVVRRVFGWTAARRSEIERRVACRG